MGTIGILSIFSIAIGLSMDSFAVCIGKGMCRQHFNPWRSFKIAVIFGLFQGIMPIAGYTLSIGFSDYIQQIDHWLAFVILVVIGLKMIYESYQPKKKDDCPNCDCIESDAIDWKKVMTLALATSIDAAATGLIFASYPGTIVLAVIAIALTTLFFSFSGFYLGVRLGKRITLRVEVVGGIILIGIGLKILLEHLLQ